MASPKTTARRGSQLREHILWSAKDVFLTQGFERASMDAVAAHAQTSKRSLYAHFENKERLFLEVIEFVRGLLLARLQTPGDHAAEPVEALTLFCGRYLRVMRYEATVRMCRVSIAEAARFPEGAARYFDVLFTQVHAWLRAYFEGTFGLPGHAAGDAADRLLGRVLYPGFARALFGMDPLPTEIDLSDPPLESELRPVRTAVTEVLATLSGQRHPR